MRFPPEIFLIGAQKAGTTTLASLLDFHPEINVSEPKETHYFTHNYNRGIEWYKDKFDEKENILVDASTSYTMANLEYQDGKKDFNNVPYKVFSLNPSSKFIYILRNPVDRTYSGYWHNVRTGRTTKDFSEFIRDNNFHNLNVSDYYSQLALWLKYFPLNSFLIIKFEDLIERPEETMKKCFEFIGVNTEMNISIDKHENKSYVPSFFGRKINRLRTKYYSFNEFIKKIIPNKMQPLVLKLLKRPNKEIDKMSDADREYLVNYFREKNKNLSDLTGQNFDEWNQ